MTHASACVTDAGRLCAALLVGVWLLSACGADSAGTTITPPTVDSAPPIGVVDSSPPVGVYDLAGCGSVGPTNAPADSCQTGGSVRHIWLSGRFEILAGGIARRVLTSEIIEGFTDAPPLVSTDSAVGFWTRAGDTVVVAWADSSAVHVHQSTRLTWVRPDTLRDDSIWNQYIVFWFSQ